MRSLSLLIVLLCFVVCCGATAATIEIYPDYLYDEQNVTVALNGLQDDDEFLINTTVCYSWFAGWPNFFGFNDFVLPFGLVNSSITASDDTDFSGNFNVGFENSVLPATTWESIVFSGNTSESGEVVNNLIIGGDLQAGVPAAANITFQPLFLQTGQIQVNVTADETDCNATIIYTLDDAPEVSSEDVNVDMGVSVNSNGIISLDRLDYGLSAFNLTVSLEGSDIGDITGITFPDGFTGTSSSGIPGRTIQCGAFSSISGSAGQTDLLNLTYTGEHGGTNDIGIVVGNMLAYDDKSFIPSVCNGTLTVQAPPAPVAGFSAVPLSGPAPLTVQFTDSSTGSINNRLWNFGDGNNSTESSPEHTYINGGDYTVNLTVTGDGGSDSEVKNNYISIRQMPVGFYANVTSGSSPLTVQFNATYDSGSYTEPTSWLWYFGDGNTSTVRNATHTYYTGEYTVKLTATMDGQKNSAMRYRYISVA